MTGLDYPKVNGFCDYYEDLGLNVPTDLKPLLGCIDVIPCSSSECERGFSQMNIILDEKRNRLTIKHVSSSMFIQINGPPLSIWNPTELTKTWLRHHNSASVCRSLKDKTSAPKKDNIIWKYFKFILLVMWITTCLVDRKITLFYQFSHIIFFYKRSPNTNLSTTSLLNYMSLPL